MKLAIVLLVTALAAQSRLQLDVGSEVQVRLLTPISSTQSKPGDPVEAVIIAPLIERKLVRGQVRSVGLSGTDTRASIELEFKGAEIVGVDNARETVDAQGRILGILRSETLSAQMDRGLAKLGGDFAQLAAILSIAKDALVKETDPEIIYPAGTELRVKLTESLDGVPRQGTTAATVPADLIELVGRQPLRTIAAKPPLPSDFTNLLFIGSRENLNAAFSAAGWTLAEKLDANSVLETARAVIEGRGYHEAPVSTLLLDGRSPDLVFQKTTNTFAKRHHIRIWKQPGQHLGSDVWIGSATHDIDIAFAADERTFYHAIDPDVDKERQKIVTDLIFAEHAKFLALVDRRAVPRESRNATGDAMRTDGRIAVVQLLN